MKQIEFCFYDFVLITTATVAALVLRDNLEFSMARLTAILPYIGCTIFSAAIVLPASGIARKNWQVERLSDVLELALASLLIVLLTIAMAFAANRLFQVMRSLPVLQLALMTAMMTGARLAHRSGGPRRTVRADLAGYTKTRQTVLVVGLNSLSELFVKAAAEQGDTDFAVAGVLGRNAHQNGKVFRGHKILGPAEDIAEIIRELDVHGVQVNRVVVCVAFEHLSAAARQSILAIEETQPVRLDFIADAEQEPRLPRRSIPALTRTQLSD